MKEIVHTGKHEYKKPDGQYTRCNQHCPASRMQGFHDSEPCIFAFFKVSSKVVHKMDCIINGKANCNVCHQHGEHTHGDIEPADYTKR